MSEQVNTTPNRPSYKTYLAATAIGFVPLYFLTIALQRLQGSFYGIQWLPAFIVLVWFCIKVMQTCYAKWAGQEIASRSIFWSYVLAVITASLLFLAVDIVVDIGFLYWSADSWTAAALWTLVQHLIALPLMALAVSYDSGQVAAWRPLRAYWRPFYNGWNEPLQAVPAEPETSDLQDEDDGPSDDSSK